MRRSAQLIVSHSLLVMPPRVADSKLPHACLYDCTVSVLLPGAGPAGKKRTQSADEGVQFQVSWQWVYSAAAEQLAATADEAPHPCRPPPLLAACMQASSFVPAKYSSYWETRLSGTVWRDSAGSGADCRHRIDEEVESVECFQCFLAWCHSLGKELPPGELCSAGAGEEDTFCSGRVLPRRPSAHCCRRRAPHPPAVPGSPVWSGGVRGGSGRLHQDRGELAAEAYVLSCVQKYLCET